MKAAAPGPPALLLLAPLLALILGVFVAPLAWFFVRTFAEIGAASVLPLASALLVSPVVLRAIALTLWIALVVTLICALIAYPVAYVLTRARGLFFTLIITSVIIPYFTSVIVRTYSWMVLLGRNGLVNQTLLGLGIVHQPLALMYNQLGIFIGMSYVLLPYMVLTLYSIMRGIDANLLRAARGMGASGLLVFWRIHLPLSRPGLLSGCLLVFILAIGFFITPALMGGPSDVMMAMLIEREVELTLNWPAACVMSLLLLVVTMALFALYCRLTDLDRMVA